MSEEEMNQPSEPQVTSVDGSLAFQVEGQAVSVEGSLVGMINAGESAVVGNSFTVGVVSNGNASVENGAGMFMVTGGNTEINNGGAGAIINGGNTEIHNGGAGLVVCQQATVEHGTINVLLANQVDLGEDVRVLVSTRQAAAFGAAFGVVVAILSLIFCRRR
jgi:hypothetical protein